MYWYTADRVGVARSQNANWNRFLSVPKFGVTPGRPARSLQVWRVSSRVGWLSRPPCWRWPAPASLDVDDPGPAPGPPSTPTVRSALASPCGGPDPRRDGSCGHRRSPYAGSRTRARSRGDRGRYAAPGQPAEFAAGYHRRTGYNVRAAACPARTVAGLPDPGSAGPTHCCAADPAAGIRAQCRPQGPAGRPRRQPRHRRPPYQRDPAPPVDVVPSPGRVPGGRSGCRRDQPVAGEHLETCQRHRVARGFGLRESRIGGSGGARWTRRR